MNTLFIFLLMIFCHIVDDYYLQGWLASAKQKEWWVKNSPDPLYKHDYIWALLMHSFSWSFMIMLPIAYVNRFAVNNTFLSVFICNVAIHMLTDDMKANKKWTNLWIDQMIHLLQIIATVCIFLR